MSTEEPPWPASFRVWCFPTDNGAQRAVYSLGRGRDHGLRLDDVAVVSWPETRTRPVAWQVSDIGGENRFSGAFWGMLVGLLFLLPLSRASEAPRPDSAGEWSNVDLARFGLDASFAEAVRADVVPGTSALFTVDSSVKPAVLTAALPRFVTEVARRDLDVRQVASLHAGFDD